MAVSLHPSITPLRLRRALLLALSASAGVYTLHKFRALLRSQRRAQAALAKSCLPPTSNPSSSARPPTPAVDRLFLARLRNILRICIPSLLSRESLLIAFHAALLLSRTLLSDYIAALEGTCGEKITAQNWPAFIAVLKRFAAVAFPAALVNAALKATQIILQLAFRRRLTLHLHSLYAASRAYYSATLGALPQPEARLTDDVDKFCETLAELYSRTFKPALDVLFFTRSLSKIIGYKGQVCLYVYFIVIGAALKALSPPLGLMAAQYAALNSDFRAAHARVAASAEEIAFNDPPAGRAEMIALNRRLEGMLEHSKLTACQRFVQSTLDGYATKYTASVIGLTIFAIPLYLNPRRAELSESVVAGQYINTMRLMMQSSTAMGSLVVVHKRINTLAGYTARVSELLEQVRDLGRPNGRLIAFENMQKRVTGENAPESATAESANGLKPRAASGSFSAITDITSARPAKLVNGPNISLENVFVWSPDGTLLVRDLSIDIPPGSSCIIEGPNGSGKSSLLRVLANLWPIQSGTVTLPSRDTMFFLSQTAYVYVGGSLADQLMYPNLPGVVVGEKVVFDEDHATACLAAVELPHLRTRCNGYSGALAWLEVLSGGERNRLAVARLLYHRPRFAFLDECTAAVSADGELVLYKAMKDAGISLVSVAHRRAVRPFHDFSLVLKGDHDWEWKAMAEGGGEKKK